MRTPLSNTAGLNQHRGGRRPGRGVLALALLLLAGGALVAVWWYWRRSTLAWTVQDGLAALATAAPTEIAAALDAWERRIGTGRAARREELAEFILARHPLDDHRVRTLLVRVSGADYADRRDDWRQWLATRQRLRRGETPRVPAAQRVRLQLQWQAPIGLTDWFTSIIPLDGQIYVATLGAAYNDPRDAADGIVRVDGRTGQAELFFRPSEGRVRDVIGLAAGRNCLFAACRNGLLYCVRPDGTSQWQARIGDVPAGPPLAYDLNRDGVTDVAVVAAGGQVVAFNGRDGTTLWATAAPRRAARREGAGDLGAALAVGRVLSDDQNDVIVTTPPGQVHVLNARTGQVRWQTTLAAGALAGPTVSAGLRSTSPPVYLVDRSARIWSLVRSRGGLQPVPSWDALARTGEDVIASLRTAASDTGPPLVIACPTGGLHASVCAFEPAGPHWRYSPGGAIWATPALADLNGDRETEIVVASIDKDQHGQVIGTVTVLSVRGHCLQRLTVPAAIRCSPVVAHVTSETRLELLIADQAGWLHCYATQRPGRIEWGLLGGDSHNTRNALNAFGFGQAAVGKQWSWQPN